jgi:hypothetical protein
MSWVSCHARQVTETTEVGCSAQVDRVSPVWGTPRPQLILLGVRIGGKRHAKPLPGLASTHHLIRMRFRFSAPAGLLHLHRKRALLRGRWP